MCKNICHTIYFCNNTIIVQVRYIIIETKEFVRIGYNGFLFPHSYSDDGLGATHLGLHLSTHVGFLFPHSYSDDGLGATHLGLHLSTHVEKETRYIQYGPLLLFQ